MHGSSFLRDTLWQASGNTFAQILGILALPVLSRLYSPSSFAVLNLFTQVVGGLAIVMTLRFEYLVMLPASDEESGAVMRLTVRMGAIHVLLWTLLFYILPRAWPVFDIESDLVGWLWLAPITAFAVSVSVAFQQLVQRTGDFRTTALGEFVGRSAYVATALIGSLAQPAVIGLLIATASNSIGKIIFISYSYAKFFRSIFITAGQQISISIRRIALTTSFSNFVSLLSSMAPMAFIANKFGAAALGQYGMVVSTLYLPSTLLGQAIGQVYYQRACRLYAEESDFSHLLIATTKNLVLIGLPLYGLIASISPVAYPLVFGAEWSSAGELAPWMSVAAAAGFLSTPLDRTSLVVNAWWYLTTWHCLRAVGTIICLVLAHYFDFSLQYLVAMLSLHNAIAYSIDWIVSYILAGKVRKT